VKVTPPGALAGGVNFLSASVLILFPIERAPVRSMLMRD
jgi:hypothetical protein